MWPFPKSRFNYFWLCATGPLSINSIYQGHIWQTWFYVNFFKCMLLDQVLFLNFVVVTFWILLNKLYISGGYLTDLILSDFIRRSSIGPCLMLHTSSIRYGTYATYFILCDLFFISSPIFIIINHIMSLKQMHLFFSLFSRISPFIFG